MIHDLNEKILTYLKNNRSQFEKTIFSFDDGLFSVYYYYKEFRELFPNNILLVCISTNIYCKTVETQIKDIDSRSAHNLAFNHNYSAYMTLNQIKELNEDTRLIICGHGHNHLHAKLLKNYSLKKFYEEWINDFKLMLEWFKINNFEFNIFCTPYNEANDLLFAGAKKLKQFEIIGPNRIDIEKLIKG